MLGADGAGPGEKLGAGLLRGAETIGGGAGAGLGAKLGAGLGLG